MAAITCDICGGNLSMDASGDFAVCESCGMKHTKDRVKAKAQEITGTVAVSNITHYENVHQAAANGIVQDVAYFIENGTSVKGVLSSAARNSNIEVVKYLISKGAYVNETDEDKQTPLHIALKNNSNIEVAKYLISKGANVNARDEDKQTPLHVALNNKSMIGVVEYLISNGANVNARNNYHSTPLHIASCSAPANVVEYLISVGADVDARDDRRKTPRYYATDRADVERILNEAVAKTEYPQLVQAKSKASTEKEYQDLASQFRRMNAYIDTSELVTECENQYLVLKKRREEREELERREQEENKRHKAEEQSKRWQEQGLCKYCGGKLSLFWRICKSCRMDQ